MKEEAKLTRSQLQAQTADFEAKGGKAVECDTKTTKQIIDELKAKSRSKEDWHSEDSRRMREKKK